MGRWRRMVHQWLLTAAGVVVVLSAAACAPPFNLELNRVSGLVKRMTLVGSVGPVDVTPDAVSVRLLPSRPTAASLDAVKVSSGFLVVGVQGQDQLSFVSGSSSSGGQTFATTGGVSPYPLNQYDVTNTLSGLASIVVSRFDGTSTSTYQQFQAAIAGGSLTPVNGPLAYTGVLSGNPTLLGAAEVPGTPTALDTWVFLGTTSGVFVASVASMDGSATTFPSGVATAGIPVGFTPPPRSFYYFSTATGASLTCFYLGGWNTVQWFGSSALTEMTGVTARVDAVLSTGDYLSSENGTLRLYDPGGVGTEVLTTDLRGLQFCYEAYVGSSPYVFFVLPSTSGHGKYAFAVYAIPSSAMRTLK